MSTNIYEALADDSLAVVNLIRALGGFTDASSAETVFDTESFKDKDYVDYIKRKSGNLALTLNWLV